MIACIPTKGRYTTKTYKLYEEAGIEYLHFVEPQDYDRYDVPNKVNICANNMGIAYVRNYILQYAKKNEHRYIIMSDDDITDFGVSIDKKCYTKDASIWNYVLEKAKKLPYAMYGINYRQHAWEKDGLYRINTRMIEVCVLLDISKITWGYRDVYNLKEDRDFVLQSIKYSDGCIKFTKLFYNAPALGKSVGGLSESYKNNEDGIAAKRMCAEWHPFSKMINISGRLDVKIDMRRLSKYYKKHTV